VRSSIAQGAAAKETGGQGCRCNFRCSTLQPFPKEKNGTGSAVLFFFTCMYVAALAVLKKFAGICYLNLSSL
jgi:hypothetical protein